MRYDTDLICASSSHKVDTTTVTNDITMSRVMGIEVDDPTAVTIASWWQSSGTVGRHLATLASGMWVQLDLLLWDIAQSREEADTPFAAQALDMLATWAINHPSRRNKFEHIDLMVCTDCAMLIASGEVTDGDGLDLSETLLGLWRRHLGDDAAHLVNGESSREVEFSSSPCGACGEDAAGTRHHAVVLRRVEQDA